MTDIFWSFAFAEAESLGALAPSALDLEYSHREINAPQGAELQRAFINGRTVVPSDCPPIRAIASYGLQIFCPGRVEVSRASVPTKWRKFDDKQSQLGSVLVSGDSWPTGDSGKIASWLTGSEYVKIQSGISLYFPCDSFLYQGPLPNSSLINGSDYSGIMAGIEYPSKERLTEISGATYCRADINIICSIPESTNRPTIFEHGDPLAWCISIPKKQKLRYLTS